MLASDELERLGHLRGRMFDTGNLAAAAGELVDVPVHRGEVAVVVEPLPLQAGGGRRKATLVVLRVDEPLERESGGAGDEKQVDRVDCELRAFHFG